MNTARVSTSLVETVNDCILAVHGGAGVLSREAADGGGNQDDTREALRAALRAGYAELQKSDGSSVNAVLAAVCALEDAPCFNAGKGAAFTRDGRIELDAAVMDGATHRAGAVAGVTTVKNPIVAARLVMDRSKHVLLIGPAADEFARHHGAETVDPRYFHTEKRWKMLQEELHRDESVPDVDAESRSGTVGCVALDARGNLAAGTSTGGTTGKLSGRAGDTPIIGGGTLADNASCAVSATGDGEYFIRAVAAHDIAALVAYKGLSIAEAVHAVIHEKIKPAGGEGGAIVLGPRGNLAMTYCSEGMYRGYITRSGAIRVMIYRDL
jgi:L-asparaginase / beta-aspartyl-peptidase